ncbi:hypothetical protein OQJ15_03100 [Fluoribacter dumoffii]|uniref:MotA/TolQ/ExbB proton channel domain-containing protein n=1 Tax=Fluoribacter dumoffii TaxID=463 RepID=A0A377G9C1_9GAMM|nr:hypothetical protein [Fluoribacter dumoffii]KTC89993.1 hypothetical protein Ldum_1061 [Fluoribacter dumoffii NY 23]MCW8385290.1 hypothetical protein [Fluoribacter dumoffii]MCW8496413.1 hypothetical protein [Fluoribacter dumoffii]STO21111.1 Uncharacterised protein [Fluoribacter dumoffii]
MLELIGYNEIREIFDLDNEAEDENYLAGIIQRSRTKYSERPGFFTPYRNVKEFAGELLAPLWYPLESALGTGLIAFTALISACYAVGYLLCGLLSIAMMSTEHLDNALEGFANSISLLGLTLLGTAAGALLTVISIPHSIVSIFTRSTATLISASKNDCCEQDYYAAP